MAGRKRRADGRTSITLKADLYDVVKAYADMWGDIRGEVSTRQALDIIVTAFVKDIPWQRIRELGPKAMEEKSDEQESATDPGL